MPLVKRGNRIKEDYSKWLKLNLKEVNHINLYNLKYNQR